MQELLLENFFTMWKVEIIDNRINTRTNSTYPSMALKRRLNANYLNIPFFKRIQYRQIKESKMSTVYKWIKVSLIIFFLGTVNLASACTPYGLIGLKWNQLKAAVGNCINDEGPDGVGGRIQSFSNGWINWDGHSPAAFAVYGSIGKKWMILGGPKGYGHPITDETDSGGQIGRYNLFDRGGSIIWKKMQVKLLQYMVI